MQSDTTFSSSVCDAFAFTPTIRITNGDESLQTRTLGGSVTGARTSRIFLSNKDKDNDEEDKLSSFNAKELSERIQQIQKSESEESARFTRVEELQSSQKDELQFDSTGRASVPLLCFDAMVPGQKMEGSTADPVFINLLLNVGLGGWFGMTSLDFENEMMRRNGVLCKVKYIDVAKMTNPNQNVNDAFLPTLVNFVITAKRRFRVIGKGENLELRVGMWRRAYDFNEEESLLGWGEERFLDLPSRTESKSGSNTDTDDDNIEMKKEESFPSTHWTQTNVECNLDETENNRENASDEIIQKAQSILPLIDQWYDLASNPKTYQNVNVTASTRVKRNQPNLVLEADKLLLRIHKELGPRPSHHDPNLLAFWGAALINPLPPLGISLEIRGKMLEADDVEERLRILEFGLIRSIQNLKGERPL